MDPNGGLDVTQVVFKATGGDVIEPVSPLGVAVPGVLADAVEAEQFHSVVELLVVCDDHSALSGRQVLRRIKAVTNGVTPLPRFRTSGTNGITLIVGADGMGSILDDVQAFLLRKAPDNVHVAWQT